MWMISALRIWKCLKRQEIEVGVCGEWGLEDGCPLMIDV